MNRLAYLAEIMPAGKENALRRRELSELLNLPDRETRLLVERLRRSGFVVCSDESGYYRPAGIDELRAYCRKCRKRRRSIYEINKSAEKLLKVWTEQANFDNAPLFGGDSLV